MKIGTTLILCIIFSALAPHALAHGSGQTIEQVVDNYIVDIGYDSIGIPVAGDPIRFDFGILDINSLEPIEFTDVWIKISQGPDIFFAGSIRAASFGPTGMTFTFPEGGEFQMSARFHRDNDQIAEAKFPFPVNELTAKAGVRDYYGIAGVGIMSLIIGFLIASFLKKRNRDSMD